MALLASLSLFSQTLNNWSSEYSETRFGFIGGSSPLRILSMAYRWSIWKKKHHSLLWSQNYWPTIQSSWPAVCSTDWSRLLKIPGLCDVSCPNQWIPSQLSAYTTCVAAILPTRDTFPSIVLKSGHLTTKLYRESCISCVKEHMVISWGIHVQP